MLTKEPEMLQPDAFCDHTMQQNVTAARDPPRTPLGELTALLQSPDPLAGFKRGREGWEEKGRRGARREGKGRGRGV